MKLVEIIFCMLFLVTIVWADMDTVLIREAGISNLEELQEITLKIARSILVEREEYPLMVLYENWENEAWVYDMKDTHSYDENGYPSEILMQDWEEGEWVNFMKMCTDCDAQGLTQEATIEIWDAIENIWQDMLLMTYTYDANGNWTEIVSEMWVYDQYMFTSRILREYNNQNLATFESNQLWDYGGNWVNNSQTNFSYSGMFLTEELEESWQEDSFWENSKLKTYVEAGNDHPSELLLQTWDGGGSWVNNRRSDYTYDGDWHEIENYEQVWEADAWMNFQTHYYSYDDDNLLERLTKEWESERSWINHSKYTVEYGNLQSDDFEIPEQVDFKLTNYPNPFNPETEIRFQVPDFRNQDAKIEIYNIKGQYINSFLCHPSVAGHGPELVEGDHKIISGTWNGRDNFGHPAPSGIYYYKLRIGNEERTKKMVLMK